jgi:hypothetical protein
MKKIKNAQIWGVGKTRAVPPGERHATSPWLFTPFTPYLPRLNFSLTTIVAKWILHFALKRLAKQRANRKKESSEAREKRLAKQRSYRKSVKENITFSNNLNPNIAFVRHQQNPDQNGLTKPGSERIDKTRIGTDWQNPDWNGLTKPGLNYKPLFILCL